MGEIVGDAGDGVTSSWVETELIALSSGSRCGGVERGEMCAIGGASGDAGRKGTGSPGDDKDSSTGDSVLTGGGAISAADAGVDSNSQDLEDWLRVPGSNDWSGDRATGSESSVEISSRGEDERVDDERRGASVSSGGSDSVRGDRPNFETGLSDVDAGSGSGSGCSSVTDVTGDGRNVDESGDKGWSVEMGNDNKGTDIDVDAASCSDSG
ncbi:hypothetical protein EDB85DRAFT_1989271 [Lactarius pseudohatsudake]|nr:hypothetical protein EDB85DRAFT_1989271 [Lactarius pseudohatsudake]